ncbi:ornithine cyclodeaminase family protein [Saccharomonospora sp. NPDC046836]|uniref:ornithine cyclodeaminase family protein n=1 Tax=Saccharomonospora sp. NPDC046836 TaxID=3156921 RepID=UPI0033C3AE34
MIPVLPMPAAIAALQAALRAGLEPEADPPRSVVPVRHGQLLLMPADWDGYTGVKLASVAPGNSGNGLPRIQGTYLLLDAGTLSPLGTLDGIALTAVRTAAVSAVAADLLAGADAARLVVFGSGPQARSHVAALRAVRPIREVIVVARDAAKAEAFAAECARDGLAARTGTASAVAHADLIACCTTARTPLFDGATLNPRATVVAVGSHEPEAREVDDVVMGQCAVVVETRTVALREAGDVMQAVDAGALDPAELIELSALAKGAATLPPGPRIFKSVGMAWEDLVVAAASYEASRENHRGR